MDDATTLCSPRRRATPTRPLLGMKSLPGSVQRKMSIQQDGWTPSPLRRVARQIADLIDLVSVNRTRRVSHAVPEPQHGVLRVQNPLGATTPRTDSAVHGQPEEDPWPQTTQTVSDLLERIRSIEAAALADHTVPDLGAQPSFGKREDFIEHAEMLAREFSGQSLLVFAHAIETVRIRREIALQDSLKRFFELWEVAEADLLAQLNTRWLVSACDTFADHGPTAADRAYGLAGTLYLNAVKMAETERHVASSGFLPHVWHKAPWNKATPLFDGVICLVQHDDMPANLGARVARCTEESIAARITAEIHMRVRTHDTFVRRLARSSQDYRSGNPVALAFRIRQRLFG